MTSKQSSNLGEALRLAEQVRDRPSTLGPTALRLATQLLRMHEALVCLRETTAYDEYGYVKACVDHGLGDDSEWDNWEHEALNSNQDSESA